MDNRSDLPETAARPRRRSVALDLGTIALKRRGARSLHLQVADAIREAILTGRLAPGAPLPSTRLLAEELGVSRNTTSAAFDRLTGEGLLLTTTGSGTRVTRSIPAEFLSLARSRAKNGVPSADGLRPLANTAARLATIAHGRYAGGPKAFAPGVPGIDQFPIAAWTTLTARRWRSATVRDLCSPQAAPAQELCDAIAAHAGAARGAVCDPSAVLAVTGTQQAVDLTARILTDPGDICWIEEPGYLSARFALIMAGLRLVGAPVDEGGLDVEKAIATLPPPRLIYVTPSHQYPMGGTLSLERRIALLQYAARVGAWVIEDDYDSEFASAGAPVPCLQGLDAAGRVIYVGSFNKTMFPSLRLGFLIAPPDLIETFQAARSHSDGHPPTVTQGVLAEFISSGNYVSHLRRMRGIYARRRDILTESLRRHLPILRFGVHDRGLHFVAYLPDNTDDEACAAAAASVGIIVAPLSRFYLEPVERRGLLFGFACVPENEIEAAVIRLRDALPPI